MTPALATGLVGGALLILLIWLLVPTARRDQNLALREDDPEELEAAEEEMRELDVFTTPDEADDHLPDWGPGAPK